MNRKSRDDDSLENLRKRAEKRMRDGEIDPADDRHSELMRLNYELEVHRVELEMQNEELRRTVSQLEESRNEFVDLYQFAPVAFLNVGSDGLIKDANEAAFALLPCSPKFLVGSAFVNLVFAKDQHIYFSYLKNIANSKTAAPCELRLQNRNDGHPQYVQLSASRKLDERGRLRFWRLALVDISERKQAEQVQEENERIYRELAANLPNGAAFIVDHDLRYVLAEGQAIRAVGLAPGDLEGKTIWEALDSELASRYEPHYREALRGHPSKVEHFSHGRHFATHFSSLQDSERIIGALAVSYDITDRKHTEDKLEQSLAQFIALFNQMTEGLAIFDPEGNLVDMNPAALAIHGYERAEKIQRHFDTLTDSFELFDLEGHPLTTDKWPIGRVMRGETFDAYEVRVRNRHTGKSWIGSYGGTPVRDSEGTMLLSIVTLRDITAQKRAEKILREYNESLEKEITNRTAEIAKRNRQLQELNAFIKNMTKSMIQSMENDRRTLSKEIHDSIGGSLAGIKMLLENRLGKVPQKAPEGITPLETIVDHLVDTIKESKKISNKMRPMALDDFGLKAALSENITRFKEFYPNIEVNYQVRVSPDDIPDEIKTTIYRVIQEALNNVGKHSRATSAKVTLTESDDQIMLMVEDNGIGFDIRSSFDTGQPLQSYGLLSMKERVEICRGVCRVESSPGTGTRISASIPKNP